MKVIDILIIIIDIIFIKTFTNVVVLNMKKVNMLFPFFRC